MKEAQLMLVIDTCGATGTIALVRVEEFATVTVAEAELAGRTFASTLVSRISEVLNLGAVQLGHLAAVAVVHGPGGFTGVRIGVAAAKALAEGAGKPLIAISRLAVLCRQANLHDACCGLLDAGRGEFYAGLYRGVDCIREMLITRDEVEEAIDGATLVAAEDQVAASFPHATLIRVPLPIAADAATIAAVRLRCGSFDDPAILDGNYLRRTDAQLFARPQTPVMRTPAVQTRPGRTT
jgi:tRNA threonylcarbamoyladenosine biosynthesis protein TsaB